MALIKIMYRGQTLFSPKHDRVFKALFDDGEYVMLASFLSNVLDADIKAEELHVRNTEMPVENTGGKLTRLDFRITLMDGSVINVEMQVKDEHDMGRRSLYNTARLMPNQLKTGGEYRDICPVIAINIVDFNFITDSRDYLNRYRMKNLKTNADMPDADVQEIIFIELPKLPKTAGSLKEWWLKFLAVKTEEELDMIATQDPILKQARDVLIKINADPDLQFKLEMFEKADRDYYSSMARNRREGREEGLEKGLAEANAENARKMKAKGFDSTVIMEITGLSLKQIEKI